MIPTVNMTISWLVLVLSFLHALSDLQQIIDSGHYNYYTKM